MDEIVNYFTEIFHLKSHYDLPLRIVTAINALDRAERGELKARLFNEAKRFGQAGYGLQAIRWVENAFALIEKNTFRIHEVLFSPGQDIPENIAYYINNAKKTIDLCVFTISDEMLGRCLMKARERGVKIRIITDNNKMRDAGSQIKDLARVGIQVKTDNSRYHMHNKFGIIDGRIAFTGSYNWTYTAKAYNQENLLITTNYTIVHRLLDEYAQLWQEMFWLRVKQQKDGYLKATLRVGDTNQEVPPTAADLRRQTQPKADHPKPSDKSTSDAPKPAKPNSWDYRHKPRRQQQQRFASPDDEAEDTGHPKQYTPKRWRPKKKKEE